MDFRLDSPPSAVGLQVYRPLEVPHNSPGVPRRLLLSKDRALHTGDSRPQEAGSGNLPPLVAGAVDHLSEQLRYPHAPHKWLAASDRDSPGLYADKDGDEAVASSAPNGPELLAAPRPLLRSSCPCSSASISRARAHFSFLRK